MFVIGTAGHVDHGKSTLVHALTGIDPDRLKEEQLRGITIDLGFAHLDLGDVQVGFVDVPGHERFVKNMLAGVGGIDFVLLVVAADESIMPQTREHFDICRLLGVNSGIVVINKTDLVGPQEIETVVAQVRKYNPRAAAIKTVRCGAPLDFILNPSIAKRIVPEPTPRSEEFESFAFTSSRMLSREKFEEFVLSLHNVVFRAKGFVRFSDGVCRP